MAANINDKFTRSTDSSTARPVTAQLAAPGKALAAPSVNLNVVTNWATSTAIHVSFFKVNAQGYKDPTTQTDWKGTLSGTVLSNLQPRGGTDQTYTAGDYAEITPTDGWNKDLIDGILTHSDQSGNLLPGIVGTTTIANGGVVTDKLTAISFTGNMSALATITTTLSDVSSVTLPAVTAAHKYLIHGIFSVNHGGSASTRDYSVAIRNGTTTLQFSIWSASSGVFINTVPVSTVFTSSSVGGQTINFSVSRSTDNGGSLSTTSHYTITDLGRA